MSSRASAPFVNDAGLPIDHCYVTSRRRLASWSCISRRPFFAGRATRAAMGLRFGLKIWQS